MFQILSVYSEEAQVSLGKNFLFSLRELKPLILFKRIKGDLKAIQLTHEETLNEAKLRCN